MLLSLEDGSAAGGFLDIHLDARAYNVAHSGMADIAVARPWKLREDRVEGALQVVMLRLQIHESAKRFRGAPQRWRWVCQNRLNGCLRERDVVRSRSS